MSRIAKEPVSLPKDVEYNLSGLTLTLKGTKGSLTMEVNPEVSIDENDNLITFAARSGSKFSSAMSGTTRALVANMVFGVSQGFEKKLEACWGWLQSTITRKKVKSYFGILSSSFL